MKKLALLAAAVAIIVAFCVTYTKPEPIEEEAQNVPTQVVRMQGIVLDMRPEPVTEIKKYGGIAYDFKEVNPIQAK